MEREQTAEELARLRAQYRLILLGTPDGRDVLRDLLEKGCAHRDKLFDPESAHKTSHNTGRHYVAQFVHERLYLSDDEMMALAESLPLPASAIANQYAEEAEHD